MFELNREGGQPVVARTRGQAAAKRLTSAIRALFLPALAATNLLAIGPASAVAADTPPGPAAMAGYRTETFSTNSNFTSRTVDMKLSFSPGYQWYFYNYYGAALLPPISRLNADGSINVASFTNTQNATLVSAARISSAPYFRGNAFGGGGYFEATLSFNAASVDTSTGWPSWWTMAVEEGDGDHGDQWVGMPSDYVHWIEPDIFEYILGPAYPNAYLGAVHDWYGSWNKTCPNHCQVTTSFNQSVRFVPAGTNFNTYHRYGLLWVPATATKKGSLTYYFDGVQVGQAITYSQFTNQRPPPTTMTPWTYGIIDQQHLVLILGTGSSTPMKVKSVSVWQASASRNLHN